MLRNVLTSVAECLLYQSAYNLFMKAEIGRLTASHPSMDYKERFKLAASNWATAKNSR